MDKLGFLGGWTKAKGDDEESIVMVSLKDGFILCDAQSLQGNLVLLMRNEEVIAQINLKAITSIDSDDS